MSGGMPMDVQQFSAEHFLVFLSHCVSDKNLLEQALEELEPTHLTQLSGQPVYAVIYYVLGRFYRKWKVLPDEGGLIAELKAYANTNARTVEERDALIQGFVRFLTFRSSVNQASLEMAYDLLNYVVEHLKIKPQFREAIQEASYTDDYEALGKAINELTLRQGNVGKSRSTLGVGDLTQIEEGERLPTYLQWFDKRVSEPGPVRGGSLTIIGPQGAGKTTMGINLGVEQSLAAVYALLVLVEEYSRAVRRKIVACATHIPTTVLEAAGDDLEKAIATQGLDYDLVMMKFNQMQSHLHVMDLTSEGDCSDVRKEIAYLKRKDMLPMYMYLDWAGILADRMMSTEQRFRDNKTAAIENVALQVSNMAREFDIFTAVSQQMSTEDASKGPFVVSTQYSAADCKSFARYAKYCLILNPVDTGGTGTQVVRFGKVRDDAPIKPFVLKLRGEISRFEDMSDTYSVNPRGRIVHSGRFEDDTTLPDEDG